MPYEALAAILFTLAVLWAWRAERKRRQGPRFQCVWCGGKGTIPSYPVARRCRCQEGPRFLA
jgi:hypothetical protein